MTIGEEMVLGSRRELELEEMVVVVVAEEEGAEEIIGDREEVVMEETMVEDREILVMATGDELENFF